MKTKTVEIEIPEDMEVVGIRPIDFHYNMILELKKIKPRRFVFEEVIGRKYVDEGDYWLDSRGRISQATFGRYNLDEGQLALRKIEE